MRVPVTGNPEVDQAAMRVALALHAARLKALRVGRRYGPRRLLADVLTRVHQTTARALAWARNG